MWERVHPDAELIAFALDNHDGGPKHGLQGQSEHHARLRIEMVRGDPARQQEGVLQAEQPGRRERKEGGREASEEGGREASKEGGREASEEGGREGHVKGRACAGVGWGHGKSAQV